MVGMIEWRGISGKYGYWIRAIDTTLEHKPGNYIYAKQTSPDWTPIYIGETSSLRDRLPNHEKEACAIKNGATHVHEHGQSGGQAIRLAEKSDLVKKWDPVCNG